MARPVIADTSVYLEVIRHPEKSDRLLRLAFSQRLWLFSVVAAELYAGTRSKEDRKILRRLILPLRRDGYYLVPSYEDWTRAGEVIHRRAVLKGPFEARHHLADVLVVLTAANINGLVLTYNLGHMRTWAKYARKSGHDVLVEPYEG